MGGEARFTFNMLSEMNELQSGEKKNLGGEMMIFDTQESDLSQ